MFFKKKSKKKNSVPAKQVPKNNNESMRRLLPYYFRYNQDAVYITTSETCPCCSKYNKQVYSVLRMNQNYPPLPDFLNQNECPKCGTVIEAKLMIL